jgi:hypothetical protein
MKHGAAASVAAAVRYFRSAIGRITAYNTTVPSIPTIKPPTSWTYMTQSNARRSHGARPSSDQPRQHCATVPARHSPTPRGPLSRGPSAFSERAAALCRPPGWLTLTQSGRAATAPSVFDREHIALRSLTWNRYGADQ